VAQGLTSLPEYWNITSGSRNHWMLGGVDNWITGNIAGIQQASGSVDFQNIVIQPAIVGNMTSASGSFETNHGTIQSSWSNGSSGFALTATIPVGSTGTINLPITSPLPATPAGATYAGTASGFAQYQVGAGTYAFAGAGAVAAAAILLRWEPLSAPSIMEPAPSPRTSWRPVWYGAGTVWDVFPSRSGSFTCLPATFGVPDPVPNVQKAAKSFSAPHLQRPRSAPSIMEPAPSRRKPRQPSGTAQALSGMYFPPAPEASPAYPPRSASRIPCRTCKKL
jgi:hypothetical protein